MSIRLRGPRERDRRAADVRAEPVLLPGPDDAAPERRNQRFGRVQCAGWDLRFLVVRHRIQRYGRADDHVGCPIIGVLACASGIYSEASSSTLSVFASTTVITIKKSHTTGQTATVSIAFAKWRFRH